MNLYEYYSQEDGASMLGYGWSMPLSWSVATYSSQGRAMHSFRFGRLVDGSYPQYSMPILWLIISFLYCIDGINLPWRGSFPLSVSWTVMTEDILRERWSI